MAKFHCHAETNCYYKSMSIEVMEREIQELKLRVEQLESISVRSAKLVAKPTWRDALGALKDCDLLDEAARLGAEYRAKENTNR